MAVAAKDGAVLGQTIMTHDAELARMKGLSASSSRIPVSLASTSSLAYSHAGSPKNRLST